MDKLTEWHEIDRHSQEGQYLIAALQVIANQTGKTSFQILKELTAMQGKSYNDVQTIMPPY